MANECNWYDPACALGWIQEELKALAIWWYDVLLSSFAFVIEMFPVPNFLLDLPSYTVPPAMGWFLEPFQIEYGISIVVVAYTARFALRRVPVVG